MQLYLDANAIIFAREGAADLRTLVVQRVLEACVAPGGIVMTSLLSRLECRVLPLRQRNARLLFDYDSLFQRFDLRVLEITPQVIERATSLRADHGFRTADAIHLASAFDAGAQVFLTADRALARCPGIQVEIIRPT